LGKGRGEDDEVPTIVYTEQRKKGGEEENQGGGTDSRRTGAEEVLEMEEGVWEDRVGMDADTKTLGSHYQAQGRIHTKKREGVLTFQGRKGGGASVCGGPVEERIHPPIQVTSDITGALRSKKGQKEKNGPGLPTH